MDSRDRADLVQRHLDLARRAALVVFRRVRDHVELDELIALANTGLVEAAQRFDPDRGAAFSTFAWYRIQGAIVDGLRRMSPLPRRTWAQLIALRAANDFLEHRAERDAGAASQGVPPPQGADALAAIKQTLSTIRTMYATSLEALHDAGVELAAELPAPGDQLDARARGPRLLRAIASLPERERALVHKHYWEGKTLLEAGSELGISKSWASRLHAQAMARLRDAIEDG